MRLSKREGLRMAATLALWASLTIPALADSDDEFNIAEYKGMDTPNRYYPELYDCPLPCGDAPPSEWIVYNNYRRLARCNEPLLFDFGLYTPVADPKIPTKIRACTAGSNATVAAAAGNMTTIAGRSKRTASGCVSPAEAAKVKVSLELASEGLAPGSEVVDSVVSALTELSGYLSGPGPCEDAFMVAYRQGAVAAIYTGDAFSRKTISSVVDRVIDHLRSGAEIGKTIAAQLCGEGRNSDHVFGIGISTTNNATAVQDMLKDWVDAKCVAGFEATTKLEDVAISEVPAGSADASFGNGTASNFTRRASHSSPRSLHARGDCRTEKVGQGDGCGSLASRCGISANDFTKFNPDPNLCSTLAIGQRVCCSEGTLPDISPKPSEDGHCFSYTTIKLDTCSQIAANWGLKAEDIDKFNNGTTWGWNGCGRLFPDMNICLSEGKPPFPHEQQGSICGPTTPGTLAPTDDQDWKDLSPCPLNACCNVWGQCGISGEFCQLSESSTKSPGTSGLLNGCVSSCGTEIVNRINVPLIFGRIGYYETWNFNRPCLNQLIETANRNNEYSIIHWAFGTIDTGTWTPTVNDTFKQWDNFKKLANVKKVISFGGWGYSTEPGTYDILRQAMSPANRDTFAANIAKFLDKEGLDGVDFDWEYPGATDIDGTPGGFETDGPNYLKFLITLKGLLAAKEKTISIAAPASYWYLRNFPIAQMSKVVDYIVYMTYDLHGQWDVGNKFSIEGCAGGNCLRSHVNLTETMNSLSMITKAGVITTKIYVGESSYGRSFKMAESGCTGPSCTFLGDRLNSQAKKGRCTDTAGYISNAEIDEIISSSGTDVDSDERIQVMTWFDRSSDSDMIVYEDTEWVAYMSNTTKSSRRRLWNRYGFRGTIDWAVDLQSFTMDDFKDPKTGDWPYDDDEPLPSALSDCTGSYSSIQAIQNDNNIPINCIPVYMVQVLAETLKSSMSEYDKLISSGYDGRFKTYADAVVKGGKQAVHDWMYDNGNDYFTCDVVEEVACCNWCHYAYSGKENGECKYCDNKYCNGWDTVCENPDVNCPEVKSGWFNVTGPCPPDYSKRAGPKPDTGYGQSIYWHQQKDKEEQFWAKLYEGVGIKQEDIKFKNDQFFVSCMPSEPDQCQYRGWDYNFPVPQGFEANDVLNPKDVVSNAYSNLTNIVKDLPTAVDQLKKGTYAGDASDLAEALILPVYMIEEAVNQIKSISEKVEDWDKEKRKNIILAFITGILFFVPVVGELVGTISTLATIGRIIAILGTLGELATDIYGVVDTQGNDPLAIFSLVLSPLAVFDAAQMGKAAKISRGMSKEERAKLGKTIGGKIDAARDANKVCKLTKRNIFPEGALPMTSIHGEPIWSGSF